MKVRRAHLIGQWIPVGVGAAVLLTLQLAFPAGEIWQVAGRSGLHPLIDATTVAAVAG